MQPFLVHILISRNIPSFIVLTGFQKSGLLLKMFYIIYLKETSISRIKIHFHSESRSREKRLLMVFRNVQIVSVCFFQ